MVDQTQAHSFLEEIKELWTELGEALYPVHLSDLGTPMPDEATRVFLQEIGFPENASPDLDFTDLSDKLFTHTQLYTKSDFPQLDEYYVIGATGEGNPVCMDAKNGNIVYIDHDNGFEMVFINNSLMQFSYFLVCFSLTEKRQTRVIPATFKDLHKKLSNADPDALRENNFWATELANLERKSHS
jgi:hypothetical protein